MDQRKLLAFTTTTMSSLARHPPPFRAVKIARHRRCWIVESSVPSLEASLPREQACEGGRKRYHEIDLHKGSAGISVRDEAGQEVRYLLRVVELAGYGRPRREAAVHCHEPVLGSSRNSDSPPGVGHVP